MYEYLFHPTIYKHKRTFDHTIFVIFISFFVYLFIYLFWDQEKMIIKLTILS